jgi:hypothetical protein
LLDNGCSKHAFKCIRTRLAVIRRKKQAMIGFLKKDVAELLSNGHDKHAFGRVSFPLSFFTSVQLSLARTGLLPGISLLNCVALLAQTILV